MIIGKSKPKNKIKEGKRPDHAHYRRGDILFEVELEDTGIFKLRE